MQELSEFNPGNDLLLKTGVLILVQPKSDFKKIIIQAKVYLGEGKHFVDFYRDSACSVHYGRINLSKCVVERDADSEVKFSLRQDDDEAGMVLEARNTKEVQEWMDVLVSINRSPTKIGTLFPYCLSPSPSRHGSPHTSRHASPSLSPYGSPSISPTSPRRFSPPSPRKMSPFSSRQLSPLSPRKFSPSSPRKCSPSSPRTFSPQTKSPMQLSPPSPSKSNGLDRSQDDEFRTLSRSAELVYRISPSMSPGSSPRFFRRSPTQGSP